MATKVFYHLSTKASGSNFMDMQDGGSAPTAATTSTGWTVAKTAATNYSLMYATTERAASTFGATALPNANPDSTNGDCFRTPTALSGTFANANWSLKLSVIAVDKGGSQDGNIRVRVYKSVNSNGSSPTELTGATQAGGTVTNLDTSAAQSTDVTWSPGSAITLNNEYLFFQYAWTVTGAGGFTTCDVLLRIGSLSSVTTSDFAQVDPLTQTKTDDLNSWGETQRLGLGMSFVGDALTLTDGVAQKIGYFIDAGGETLSFSDTASAELGVEVVPLTASVGDANSLSDNLGDQQYGHWWSTPDTLTLSDDHTERFGHEIAKDDTNVLSDDKAVQQSYQIQSADTNTLADNLNDQLIGYLLSQTDTLVLSDEKNLELSYSIPNDDTLVLSDDAAQNLAEAGAGDQTLEESDQLVLSEVAELLQGDLVNIGDTNTLSDEVSLRLDWVALVSDQLILLDNLEPRSEGFASFGDTLTLDDSLDYLYEGAGPKLSDSMTLNDENRVVYGLTLHVPLVPNPPKLRYEFRFGGKLNMQDSVSYGLN